MSEQPNPPLETPTGDPEENVDLGYLEDRDTERDLEEDRAIVHRTAGDPLELDRAHDSDLNELDEYDAEELDEIPPAERGELEAEVEDAGDPDDTDK
jgi:hypothetical protein